MTPRFGTLAQERLVLLQVPVAAVPEPQHRWPRSPQATQVAPAQMSAFAQDGWPPPVGAQQGPPGPPHVWHIMAEVIPLPSMPATQKRPPLQGAINDVSQQRWPALPQAPHVP